MFNEQIASTYLSTIKRIPSLSNKERKKAVKYFLKYLDKENLNLTDGIESEDLIKFVRFLNHGEHRSNHDKKKKNLSPKTVHQIISLLRSFFEFCFANKLLPVHPDVIFNDKLKKNMPNIRAKPQPEFISEKDISKSIREIHQLLDEANESKRALLWTIYNSMTSVRVVLEAKLADLDLEHKRLLLRDRKNNTVTEVVLYRRTVEVLEEYINMFRPLSDSNYIFLSKYRDKLTTRTVQRFLKSHSLKVLGKPLTPHTLRRLGILHVKNTRASMDKIISQRRETDRRLKTSDLKFQRLIETMADGILVFTTDGTISYANQAFCDMLGYELEELAGLSIDKLSLGETIQVVLQQPETMARAQVTPYEQCLVTKQGESVFTMISPSILHATTEEGEKEEITGILAVFTNITTAKINGFHHGRVREISH